MASDPQTTAEARAIEKWNACVDRFNKWTELDQIEKDALISAEAEAMKENNDA